MECIGVIAKNLDVMNKKTLAIPTAKVIIIEIFTNKKSEDLFRISRV